jgi:hypothetical protein
LWAVLDSNITPSMGTNDLRKQNSRGETGVGVGGIEPISNHFLP